MSCLKQIFASNNNLELFYCVSVFNMRLHYCTAIYYMRAALPYYWYHLSNNNNNKNNMCPQVHHQTFTQNHLQTDLIYYIYICAIRSKFSSWAPLILFFFFHFLSSFPLTALCKANVAVAMGHTSNSCTMWPSHRMGARGKSQPPPLIPSIELIIFCIVRTSQRNLKFRMEIDIARAQESTLRRH